jgi:hypothetical protein
MEPCDLQPPAALDHGAAHPVIGRNSQFGGRTDMLSQWNSLPPVLRWGSLASALALGFLITRLLLQRRGASHSYETEMEIGAIGD